MRAMPVEAAIRKISIRSPSLVRETRTVAIAVFQIALWSGIAIAAQSSSTDDPASSLQADEVAFSKLDAAGQRIYRRSLDGLAEAEDARSQTGNWPTIEELATRGIPPFAEDPLDPAGYRWQLVRDRLAINYVGIPGVSDQPTLVIAAIEPEPGASEMAAVDETHHKLADGVVIHVGIWQGTVRVVPSPLVQFPFLDGWRRITTSR